MNACRWCGRPLVQREGERPSAFEKRRHCDRSCQVSRQNYDRARENRHRAAVAEWREVFGPYKP